MRTNELRIPLSSTGIANILLIKYMYYNIHVYPDKLLSFWTHVKIAMTPFPHPGKNDLRLIWNLNVIIHDLSPLDSENALLSIRIFSIILIASWSKCVVCNNPVFSNAPNSLEKKITLPLIS